MERAKISTITISTHIPNCYLNLTNIGKYLSIDDTIIGIKYNSGQIAITKGKYSTTIYKKSKGKDLKKINTKLFYNQITIIVNNGGNHVNVKLFSNGSLHLTGCKSTTEGKEVTCLLYNCLDKLRDMLDNHLIVRDSNGILLDNDNLIYSETKHQIIGYYKIETKSYSISNKEYEIDKVSGLYISKKYELKRKRSLLNLDGEEIGYTQLVLLKNKHKFYKKNTNIFYDWENCLIYYIDTIIGKIEYTIDESKRIEKSNQNVLEIEYKCNPFLNNCYIDKLEIESHINCINACFSLGYKINRQRLYDYLLQEGYICKYTPEAYSGIKLMYKINDSKKYICSCTSKCTCTTVTFLIFQTGKVIITGIKAIDQLDIITANFQELCKNVQLTIRKKEIIIN